MTVVHQLPYLHHRIEHIHWHGCISTGKVAKTAILYILAWKQISINSMVHTSEQTCTGLCCKNACSMHAYLEVSLAGFNGTYTPGRLHRIIAIHSNSIHVSLEANPQVKQDTECNPIYTYLRISSTEHNRTYFQVDMHRIVLLLLVICIGLLIQPTFLYSLIGECS